MSKLNPETRLLEGVEILLRVLRPYGFTLKMVESGKGSGGNFCRADLVAGERRIELHYRRALGLVRYHFGEESVAHELYLSELGQKGRNKYPGFGSDHSGGFQDLAVDFELLREDYLEGACAGLIKAARVESKTSEEKSKRLMAGYVGDTRKLLEAREAFHNREYSEAARLFGSLSLPDGLSAVDEKMKVIAESRSASG